MKNNVKKTALLQELSRLRLRNAELESLEVEHRRMETSLVQQAHELKERIKEINCLYGISRLVEKNQNPLEDIYQGIVSLIPYSWQYPEITSAQILIHGKAFHTEEFKKTRWQQSADIIVYGKTVGVLVVCYLEKRQNIYEGPFLQEERSLLDAIAERVGRMTEQKQAEKALQESERKLKNQNILLEEKNVALREIMNQVIMEKKNLENRMLSNVDQLLLPLLKKIKNKSAGLNQEYLVLLEDNLKSLTHSFGSELSRKMPKLTPREIEICNMIRSGLSSKEIAGLLNIAYRSVETYRNYIRRKLGLVNRKINLTTYLSSL